MRDGNGYGWEIDQRAGRMFEGVKEFLLLKDLDKTMETKLKYRGITNLHPMFQAIADP